MDRQESTPPAPSLSLDALFDLLSDPRRRAVLAVLASHERELTVNDLTKEIVAGAYDAPITEVARDEVTALYVTLSHSHVPRLAETSLVEYDEDRGIVAPTETLDRLEPFLSVVLEADSVDSLCDGL